MWYRDPHERRAHNRRRDSGRQAILLVNARMSDQRKQRMHRAGALVIWTVVLAGAAWFSLVGVRWLGARLFSENPRFIIRHLALQSDGKLRPEHLRQFAGVSEGMNLFAVDVRAVRQELQAVPLISSVEVTRKLPDTLVIHVSERTPAARLGAQVTTYPLAVDHEGYVLGPTSVSPDLPAITGFRERGLKPGSKVADVNVLDALRLIDACDAPKFSRLIKLQAVDVSQTDYITVVLERGERVLLNRAGFEPKLEKLCEMLKRAADIGKAIATVDLTVEKNFPVQYQP